jgi:hypothetical protein
LERSDPAVVAVAGATGQDEGLDSLDQHIQGGCWHPAGHGMGCGQMLLGDIQCRVAYCGASCADQLPRGLIRVPGQFIHIGGLTQLPLGGIRGIGQVIGGAAGQ